MSMYFAWQEKYKAALLELRPEELQQRIAEAQTAIQQRITELKGNDSSFLEELQAIDDALRMLRVLANVERNSTGSSLSVLTRSEVAS